MAQAAGAAGRVAAPTRDVAVTYRMTVGREAGELRVSWLAAEQKMRLETPKGVFIQDGRENRDTILMTEQRMFVTGTSDRRRGQGLSLAEPGDTVAREGTDRVAGHECAVWRIEAKKEDADDEAQVKRACVTADGVPLRVVEGEGEERRTTVATKVEYARQDPAQFGVPEGYRPVRSERVRAAAAGAALSAALQAWSAGRGWAPPSHAAPCHLAALTILQPYLPAAGACSDKWRGSGVDGAIVRLSFARCEACWLRRGSGPARPPDGRGLIRPPSRRPFPPALASPDSSPMRRRPVLALPALLLASPRPPPPRRLSAADRADIARAETWLNNLRTLKARFLQIAQGGAAAEGTAWISRPGRMRFEYDPPEPLAAGRRAWPVLLLRQGHEAGDDACRSRPRRSASCCGTTCACPARSR